MAEPPMTRPVAFIAVHVLLAVLACAYVYECSSVIRAGLA